MLRRRHDRPSQDLRHRQPRRTRRLGGPHWHRLSDEIRAVLGADVQFLQTQSIGDGVRCAREAVEAGATTLVSFGGDGTHSEVADGIARERGPEGLAGHPARRHGRRLPAHAARVGRPRRGVSRHRRERARERGLRLGGVRDGERRVARQALPQHRDHRHWWAGGPLRERVQTPLEGRRGLRPGHPARQHGLQAGRGHHRGGLGERGHLPGLGGGRVQRALVRRRHDAGAQRAPARRPAGRGGAGSGQHAALAAGVAGGLQGDAHALAAGARVPGAARARHSAQEHRVHGHRR
ncbi:MAG: hypothetical protein IPN77_09500 [Sandaracinaceae bacterium]|nr:hypothetical protein [Sandaracinaceae bacterium]